MAATDDRADAVLKYWFGHDYTSHSRYAFEPSRNKFWLGGGPAVDQEIKDQFGHLLHAIAAGAVDHWQTHPSNALAGIVVMDQFARNMYRGDRKTFALDYKALSWAKELLATKGCEPMPLIQQFFLAFPLMHSEDLQDQQACVELLSSLQAQAAAGAQAGHAEAAPMAEFLQKIVGFAGLHRDVIARWGRFPHRNQVLGRDSTPEEVAGLADGSIRRFGW